ncbi:MAG: serine O-acetyltransferase [Oscillospiraceae bacterium]|jgi:serine O-acetyltransferase|nr:serine O-acetyltransferase [Oscillospiraceae bacterium]
MFKRVKEDIESIRRRDPAARGALEIYFLYPGYKAVRMHRRAHRHYQKGHFFRARWLSERCRKKTGIEIHPGAKIGKGLWIDHGTGVVIGETCEIGEYCTIYQGVTLGGTGKDSGKRHPTIGSHVMIGAGASVLGPFTVGDHAKIAAGAVVLDEVPPHGTAVGVPARVVKVAGKAVEDDLDQVHLPDPVSQELCRLRHRIDLLEREHETV